MSVVGMANPVAAAEDLLKPDIEPATAAVEGKGDDEGGEDDDELEALRLAALNSIRPKKNSEQPTGFELKKHPVRNNLVAIVIPSEEDQVRTHLVGRIKQFTGNWRHLPYFNPHRLISKPRARGTRLRKPPQKRTSWT